MKLIPTLSAHAHEFVIFGGDLNTDLRNNSLVNDSIHSFAQELNLMVSTTVVASNIDYSFHAVSPGNRSLIDWLLLSSVLGPSVVAMNILDSEPNLSDHLPIVLDFKFSDLYLSCADDLKLHTSLDTQRSTTRNLNWDHANLDAYYDISRSSVYVRLLGHGPELAHITLQIAFIQHYICQLSIERK